MWLESEVGDVASKVFVIDRTDVGVEWRRTHSWKHALSRGQDFTRPLASIESRGGSAIAKV